MLNCAEMFSRPSMDAGGMTPAKTRLNLGQQARGEVPESGVHRVPARPLNSGHAGVG
jgi:hypothetical protein